MVELSGEKNERLDSPENLNKHVNYYLYTECIDDVMEIQKHKSGDGGCIQCNSSEEF